MWEVRRKSYLSSFVFIFLHLVTNIFTSSSQSAYMLIFCFKEWANGILLNLFL